MADRPGFMVYFDLAPALSMLADADAGALFKGLMSYAQTGERPALEGVSSFAFEIIRPKLDQDKQSYEEKCRKNSYSTYVREAKKRNEQPLDYESWISKMSNDAEDGSATPVDMEPHQPTSNDIERYPTTTTTTTTTTTATTTVNNIIKQQQQEGGEIADSAPEPDPVVAAVVSDYQDRINPAASPASLDELSAYARELGEAVCKRAFDIALDDRKATWSYIRAILQDKKARGVKCLADWDALEESRNRNRQGGRKNTAPPPEIGASFGPQLKAACNDWLIYKQQRGDGYAPKAREALETEIKAKAAKHGEEAVAALIRHCMASNWQSIIFDRLGQQSGYSNAPRGRIEMVPGWMQGPTEDQTRAVCEDMNRTKRLLAAMRDEPDTAGNNPAIAAKARQLEKTLKGG